MLSLFSIVGDGAVCTNVGESGESIGGEQTNVHDESTMLRKLLFGCSHRFSWLMKRCRPRFQKLLGATPIFRHWSIAKQLSLTKTTVYRIIHAKEGKLAANAAIRSEAKRPDKPHQNRCCNHPKLVDQSPE
jgi:hypothetical protein